MNTNTVNRIPIGNYLCIGDRFEIADLDRDLIGRGGMGDVYRGTDTQTGGPVAIRDQTT